MNTIKLQKVHIVTTIIALVLAVLIFVGFRLWHVFTRPEIASEKIKNLENVNSSLSGTVNEAGDGYIVIDTGWVERTTQGTQFVKKEKKIIVDSHVLILSVTAGRTVGVGPDYFRVGDKVTAYTNISNPYEDEPV